MADEQIRAVYDIDVGDVKAAEKAMESLKSATDRAADSAGKVEEAAKKAGRGTANFGQSALETGRIVQDFAQGGIGGVINNLEGFARAIGGGPGLAGGLTLLGVAFLTLRKPVGDFFDALINGANEVPKAADALTRLSDELDASKTRLKELAGQQALNNAELVEFKDLQGKVLEQEKALNAEREKRNTLEAQRKAEAAPDQASQKAVSEAIKAAGGVDKIVEQVERQIKANGPELQGLYDKRDALEKQAAENRARDPWNLSGTAPSLTGDIAAVNNAIDKALAGAKDKASQMVAGALQGDQGAIGALDAALPGRGFDRATTRGLANLAAGEEQRKRDEAEMARREKAAAERRAAREKDEAAAQAEEDRDEADRAREERRQQEQEARRMDMAAAGRAAFEAKLDAPNVKAGIDAELQAQERALNGGFTGAESQQIASGNMALAEAGRGQSSEDKLQKIIGQNQAMMDSLSLSGGDGSAAMSAFMELQQQLLWALGQLREVRMQQQQWRQMQQTSGTLLSRGRG